MKDDETKYHIFFALLVVGCFAFCFLAFYQKASSVNWLSNMRAFGAAGLVCAVAAIVFARRIERTAGTYSLTLILLIVSIVAASGSWWVAITAPVWSLLLIVSHELWYGSYQVADKRPLHPLHGFAGVLTVSFYPLLGYCFAAEKSILGWYLILCGLLLLSLLIGHLHGRRSKRFRVLRLRGVIGLLALSQAWILLPIAVYLVGD
ncbi:MAG TPA: hypothetical protein PKW95_05370 [bacterium]|nr:hypothetical protein [bacterium]